MKPKHLRPYLTTRSVKPENQETPIHFLDHWQTPLSYFYRRNHFAYPFLDLQNYWLYIDCGEEYPLQSLHYYDILKMPPKSLIIPLECAGNKRAHFTPKVFGEQWEEGAISQGKWTGVSLKDILEKAGLPKNTKEIIFTGADIGKKANISKRVPFERSLPLEKALHPDTLIAYKCNDKTLSFKHGFPFRLIVPNWYGMASVKWLTHIKAIDHHFKGPFQTDDYMYYPHKNNDRDPFPVNSLNVNSIIQQPLHLSILKTGTHEIKGIAWTGNGRITVVELSFDNGVTWNNAILKKLPNQKYAWCNWFYQWTVEKNGEYTVYARAKDSSGRVQPVTPFWNRKGYGYNAISKIKVKIE